MCNQKINYSLACVFVVLNILMHPTKGLGENSYPLQLKIGLFQIGQPTSFEISTSNKNIEIFDPREKRAVYCGPANIILIQNSENSLMTSIDGKNVYVGKNPLVLSPIGKPPNYLHVKSGKTWGKAYRGSLAITAWKSRLFAVNLVSIEEYLRSVVPSEIGGNAPEEALKSQAIAARSYAVRNITRHANCGFDLCDCVHCQVYKGLLEEHPISTKAVQSTYGQILTFDGRPANTVYHDNCGGKLISSQTVWKGAKVPYLIAHDDALPGKVPFCKLAPQKLHTSIQLKNVQTNNNGRKLKGNQRNSAKPKTAPQKPLSSRLQSESIVQLGVIDRQGRGHRVGMCQNGAIGMALSGFSHFKILSFYYPGTRLEMENTTLINPLVITKRQNQTLTAQRPQAVSSDSTTMKDKAGSSGVVFIKKTKIAGSTFQDGEGSQFRKWFWCCLPPQRFPRNLVVVHSKKSIIKKNKVASTKKPKKKKLRVNS